MFFTVLIIVLKWHPVKDFAMSVSGNAMTETRRNQESSTEKENKLAEV